MVRRHISWAVLLPALACYADTVSLPATWLDENVLELCTGDEAIVYAVPEQDVPNLENLVWSGGTLRLEGCVLSNAAARSPFLPMVIGPGQSLELYETTISDADTALVLAGGTASLTSSTVATTRSGIVVDDTLSCLNLQSVNVCIADVGLDLKWAANVDVQGSLFLTNAVAILSSAGGTLHLEDCLLQGNEIGLHLKPGSTPPDIGEDVDLVDCRWQQIWNETAQAVDLGSMHLSAPQWIDGPWTRSGVDPGEAVHPLKVAAAPRLLISDDVIDEIPLTVYPQLVTEDQLPIVVSSYTVYEKINSTWSLLGRFEFGQEVLIGKAGKNNGMYKACSCIGEWID